MTSGRSAHCDHGPPGCERRMRTMPTRATRSTPPPSVEYSEKIDARLRSSLLDAQLAKHAAIAIAQARQKTVEPPTREFPIRRGIVETLPALASESPPRLVPCWS